MKASRTRALLSEFVRVDESFLCPICGHDTWCLVSPDGKRVICPRIASLKQWGDAGYEHECDGTAVPPAVVRELPKPLGPGTVKHLCELWRRRLTPDSLHWLCNDLGLPASVLNELWIGRKGSAFTFPMRDASGSIVGARIRGRNGKKWTLRGGGTGLFIPAFFPSTDILFVPEGPTDTAAFRAMGYAAIGRPNVTACRDMVVSLIKRMQPRLTVIVADNDPDGDGLRGAKQLLDQLTEPARIILPLAVKDSRAWYNAGSRNGSLLNAAYGNSNRDWGVHEK